MSTDLARSGARRRTTAVLSAALLLTGILAATAPAAVAAPGAVVDLPGCGTTPLPANDDGSSPEVALPFTFNFFGVERSSLWVNNNGNVTFDAPLSTFTPFPLLATSREIIAPFFGDVDTRVGPIVTYGTAVYEGNPAFCVRWPDVGYYLQRIDKRNDFQLLLVDRSDITPGDVDVIFNYDRIEWETGDASGGSNGLGGSSARVGFSNGLDQAFELPGSAVNGAFLDSNLATGLIHNSLNSGVPGRYVFSFRGGTPDLEDCVELIADGGDDPTVVGEVCTSNDADTLTVVYRTSGGWELTESHVHAAADLGGFPTTRSGNPQVGRFAHGGAHEATTERSYEVPLAGLGAGGDEVLVAAHGVVSRVEGDGVRTESAWAAGERFTPIGNWATYLRTTLD